MTEQFIVEISATGLDGKSVPSPVGPFPTREAAWEWVHNADVDRRDISEANVSPLHPPEERAA